MFSTSFFKDCMILNLHSFIEVLLFSFELVFFHSLFELTMGFKETLFFKKAEKEQTLKEMCGDTSVMPEI